MSKTLRYLSQLTDTNPKWIILDGDLDANWIESMNSVMDDNKILTLASNERIVLKPHMRLIFEIRNLKFATPATVSRAGILYISDSDGYQWKAYVKSWIAGMLKYDAERKRDLQGLFDKYIEESLRHIRKSYKYLVPVVEITLIVCMCKLLESMLVGEIKGLEYVFVFAAIWCLGSGFAEKDGHDYRKEFSAWWKDKWKTIRFNNKGTIFDYYIDIEKNSMEEWAKLNTQDIAGQIDTSKSISSFTVPTSDTISAQFLMKKYISVNHSPLLVGSAGCGKTQIIKGLLNDLTSTSEEYLQQIINFNFYTDSALL
jgi:dynein heavy chain